MNIESSYNEWSSTYDRDLNLTRDLDARVTRKALGSRRCRAIVEVGCGTGKNTEFLAEIGDRVTALDFSKGMLEQAREKIRAHHVEFVEADINAAWPCTDSSAGLVVCCLVLEHIEDLGHVFTEATRVLAPGGHLYISELHPFRQYHGSKATFGRNGETCAIPAFVHHISDFLRAAEQSGLSLIHLDERWHASDDGKPPRLLTLEFENAMDQTVDIDDCT